MSDDSEPGEIKSPDISSVVRPAKRATEDRRHYKADKKLRYNLVVTSCQLAICNTAIPIHWAVQQSKFVIQLCPYKL